MQGVWAQVRTCSADRLPVDPRPTDPIDLERAFADARVGDAVARRRRRIRRAEADAASASTTGLLLQHAAIGHRVSVSTTTGTLHRGTLRWVGDDMVIVADGAMGTMVVASAITVLHAPRVDSTPTPELPGRAGATTFHELLTELAGKRAEVTIETAGGTRVRGRLEEVGVDVCRVASATTNDVVYVWLFSTTAVSSSSIT